MDSIRVGWDVKDFPSCVNGVSDDDNLLDIIYQWGLIDTTSDSE